LILLMNNTYPSPSAERERVEPRPEFGASSRRGRALPELLAPAADWDCARAAVENGADAIYFGLEKFNARMRAHNFTEADLPRLMEFLHQRGVKGYVAFNTLVFENEMAEAAQYARTMIAAGTDAAIVQDVGICRLIRRISPDFPIHVSTQMTVTSAGGVEFARALGCNLVVLARECSLQEIEKIQNRCQGQRAQTRSLETASGTAVPPADSHQAGLPLEVFVHGALCVAYSGQCLTSEALGGRSANRGECAQACRLPYELIANGESVELGDRKYLLSPQDLAGLELLPELVRLGVASLKIEGRLKSAEYVASITRIYREALNKLSGKGEFDPHYARYEMEMAFSRGLFSGWLRGINNQELVHGRFGKKRGVYLGEVLGAIRGGVLVQLEGPLKAGDGVVFDAGNPQEQEQGGRVYQIQPAPAKKGSAKRVLLSFGGDDIDLTRIHVGDRVWKTSDPELERRLRQSFEGERPRFLRALSLEVQGSNDRRLTLIGRDELGHIARFDSAMPLVPAEKQPLTTDGLRKQLGRLGGTPFKLGELKNLLVGDVLLPMSELNRLRRALVHELESQRARPLRWTLEGGAQGAECGMRSAAVSGASPHSAHEPPHLIVLVRSLEQLDAALRSGIQTLYCEFEDPKKYREAVSQFRNSASKAVERSEISTGWDTPQCEIFVAPPRIFKMGEEWILKQVSSCDADGYLVRNYDHLRFFANDRKIGDYSLNIANRLSADYFKNTFGLERVTASYDLNSVQLEALLKAAPPMWFEVTIHQHMPMFHMEHCVFCAFLTKGTDYTNCGRPCDTQELKLRDRVGAQHPVKADIGCRNTVFNALAQTGAEHVSRLLALGVRHFRLEFLNETPEQVARTINRYRQLLRGHVTGQEVWRELKLLNQLGVTRGSAHG
jgi:putative protease